MLFYSNYNIKHVKKSKQIIASEDNGYLLVDLWILKASEHFALNDSPYTVITMVSVVTAVCDLLSLPTSFKKFWCTLSERQVMFL